MKAFLNSFKYALNGIQVAIRNQRNMKIHVLVAIAVTIAGLSFKISRIEWTVVLLTIALVIGLELVNTALEDLVNLVTRERHPIAGRIKDVAAGAVLFASILAVIIGVLIFAKYVGEW